MSTAILKHLKSLSLLLLVGGVAALTMRPNKSKAEIAQSGETLASTGSGKIAFQAGNSAKTSGIYTLNADGTNLTRLTDDADGYTMGHRFSPDGQKIVFMRATRDYDNEIYIMNADGTNQTRLTNKLGDDSSPCFSPDGKKIAWMSRRGGRWQVYTMNLDGTQQTQITHELHGQGVDNRHRFLGNEFYNSLDYSPDGKKIAFKSGRDGNFKIYVMNADGTKQVKLTKDSATQDDGPRFSPDGKKIVFDSTRDEDSFIEVTNETGQRERRSVLNQEIYMINVDGTKPINLTKNSSGDSEPCFSPDGRKIVFRSMRKYDTAIYVMNVDGSKPVRLVGGKYPAWAIGLVPAPQAGNTPR